jgi:predicted NAD/FAD-dependent oxidoreductase
MRETLSLPIADRLFFAGEACVQSWATQVTGAYLSGVSAAEEILDATRGR